MSGQRCARCSTPCRREGTYSFDPNDMLVLAGGGFLDVMREPPSLPTWLTEADLDFCTGEFERTASRAASTGTGPSI